MPGFMQSLKSRLPQSPFSPPKQSAPILPAVESAEPADVAEEQPAAEEQPTAEVLPSEALLAPNASTVALTLTPANGQSSQQLASLDGEVTEPETAPAEETAPAVEPPAEPEVATVEAAVAPELPEAAPVAADITAPEVEASLLAPVEEVSVEEIVVPDLPASEDAQEAIALPEPLTPSASAGVPAPTENQEVLTEETTPAEKVVAHSVRSNRSITRKEPPVLTAAELAAADATSTTEVPAVATTVLEADSAIVAPQQALQKSQTGEVKEVKPPKKKRFGLPPLKSFGSSNNSDGGNSTDESGNAAAGKPKKTLKTPLAGRFKNVLGQVRSRVKKDKDSEHSTPTKETSSDTGVVGAGEERISSDDKVASSTDQLASPAEQADVVKTIEVPVDAAVPNEEAVIA